MVRACRHIGVNVCIVYLKSLNFIQAKVVPPILSTTVYVTNSLLIIVSVVTRKSTGIT